MRISLTPAAFLLLFAAQAQPGALDPSFGTNGVAVLQPGTYNDDGFEIVVAPDTTSYSVSLAYVQDTLVSAVTHLLANGELDTAFGEGGFSYFRAGYEVVARAIVRNADGSLIVAGDADATGAPLRVMLAKLLADGSPDASFGEAGFVVLPLGSGMDFATDLALDTSGRIITVGLSLDANGYFNSFILRLTPDGALDSTFSDDGKLFLTEFQTVDGLNKVVVTEDGAIYAAGEVQTDDGIRTLLVKAAPTGQWDSSFGSGGNEVVSFGGTEDHGLSMAWDGAHIYACGYVVTDGINRDGYLARFDPDGALDSTFNGTGSLIIDLNESDVFYDLHLQADGRVLACGSTGVADSLDVLVIRAMPDGVLDTDLDYDGVVVTSIDSSGAEAHGIALQPDNKIIITGATWPSDVDLLVARYFGGSCDLDPAIAPAELVLCPGASDTLGTSALGQYQWYANGQAIDGATEPLLPVDGDDAGTWFTVAVTDYGCAATSDSVLVDGYLFLLPYIINEGDAPNLIGDSGEQVYCQGDDPVLSLGAPYDTNVQWSNNGEPIPGANDPSYAVTGPGSYTVEGAPAACPDFIQSPGVEVVMEFHPYIQPMIQDTGILLCPEPEGLSAQWYYNGSPVAGLGQCVIPIDAGNYTVFVDYGDSCSVLSAPFMVIGILEHATEKLSAAPVPTEGPVTISWTGGRLPPWRLADATGRIARSGLAASPPLSLDLSDLEPGRYHFLVSDGRSLGLSVVR